MCVSRDLKCEDVNLEISPSSKAEAKFTRSFRPNILIFVITLKDTFYCKRVCCYWSCDLSNYQSWVSASLNTNRFSKLTKDKVCPRIHQKFSPANNTGVEHSPKFSLPKLEITNLPKFSPTRMLCYTVSCTQNVRVSHTDSLNVKLFTWKDI